MSTHNMSLNDFIYYFQDFSNFLKQRQVVYNEEDTIDEDYKKDFNPFESKRQKINRIIDINTKLECIHYFPAGIDVDTFYNENFYPMMKKRFDRIISYIKQSETILFISFFIIIHLFIDL